jgi:UPF0755 protein
MNISSNARLKWVAMIVGVFLVGFGTIIVVGSVPPGDFPVGTIVTIPKNSGLSKIADDLATRGIIRSTFLYKAYVVLLRYDYGVQAGDYLFDAPQSALRVAYRTVYGVNGLPRIKVTIPEGSNSKDISDILAKNISGFASTTFFLLAKAQEGYLFPDTYFFYQNTTPQEAVSAMRADFDARIAGASSSINRFLSSSGISSGSRHSQGDIVKTASIVEKEATSSADRRIIAGILWKRLADNYPLQVDPPFFYFLGKDSSQLTLDDLAVDSPYNLYKHTGLPPTPIDSPGLDAIIDTVTPTATSYWYYLSDSKGNIHYAVTYEEHLANKAKWVN